MRRGSVIFCIAAAPHTKHEAPMYRPALADLNNDRVGVKGLKSAKYTVGCWLVRRMRTCSLDEMIAIDKAEYSINRLIKYYCFTRSPSALNIVENISNKN